MTTFQCFAKMNSLTLLSLGCLLLLLTAKVNGHFSSSELEMMVTNCSKEDYNATQTLPSIQPEMTEFVGSELQDKCYDSSVNKANGIAIDIFQENVLEIVAKFFKAFPSLVSDDETEEDVQQRVCTLLSNSDYLVKEVAQCIEKLSTDEHFTPTRLGITELAAYTESELHGMLNHRLKGSIHRRKERKLGSHQPLLQERQPYDPNSCDLIKNDTNLPETFDLRDFKVVTPIKRQLCGDCYVHAAMAAIESKYLLTKLTQFSSNEILESEAELDEHTLAFSRQDPLNCLRSGCDGGTPDLVVKEVADRGLELESAEPYTGSQNDCPEAPNEVFQTALGPLHYCQTEATSDDQIRSMLFHHGPLTVALATAEIPSLLRGTFNGDCKSEVDSLDHQVLLIGWTTDGYWILKNSYGDHYGVDGYLYLSSDVPNKCGLWNDLLFPYFGDNIYVDTSVYDVGQSEDAEEADYEGDQVDEAADESEGNEEEEASADENAVESDE